MVNNGKNEQVEMFTAKISIVRQLREVVGVKHHEFLFFSFGVYVLLLFNLLDCKVQYMFFNTLNSLLYRVVIYGYFDF